MENWNCIGHLLNIKFSHELNTVYWMYTVHCTVLYWSICPIYCTVFTVVRAGNSLICSSLIRSFRSNQMSDCERFAQVTPIKRARATVSESLRSLISKEQERPWANRSDRPWQMSHHERFAQVAHKKWANERFAQQFLAKKSKILFFSMFYIRFYFKKWANPSFPLF